MAHTEIGLRERRTIEDMLNAKMSVDKIAAEIGRHRSTQAARQIRAGQVFVNEWYAGGVETPFGGYGKSGYGREKGREALWNYVQTKNVAIKLKG